ncbi:MAG: hypothetical protein KDD65_18730, partial [Bacteroidetes bacterium]|nr:hypothetical protein [Bacteroidota bacterium]
HAIIESAGSSASEGRRRSAGRRGALIGVRAEAKRLRDMVYFECQSKESVFLARRDESGRSCILSEWSTNLRPGNGGGLQGR